MPDCNVCGRKDTDFSRMGSRRGVRCSCGSLERHRFMACLIRNEIEPGPLTVLHLLGSERSLARWLVRYGEEQFNFVRPCNLLQIPHNNLLDLIVHNHVMEHIKNDRRAFNQQFKAMRAGGKLIFTIPVLRDENGFVADTVEFDRNLSKAERREHYGQHDHERYYGYQDVLDKLADSGFEARLVSVSDLKGGLAENPARFKVPGWMAGFVATKPEET